MCGLKYGPKLEKPLTGEKSKNGQTRSQNSTMLEGCKAFTSSIRKIGNTNNRSTNARRKLEVPMDAAMPCKKGTKKHFPFQEAEAKSCESSKIPKTKHACIVEPHESTRQSLESSLPKDHEDHIAGKGYNSMTHYNFFHKCILMPQAMNIPDAKAAVGKEWKKLEKNPAWQLDKVKSKKDFILEARRDKKKVHFADGRLSSQKMRSKNQYFRSIQVESYSKVTFVKDDSGAHAVFTAQSSSAPQMTAAKVNGCYCKIT